MRLPPTLLLALCSLLPSTQALFFYLDGTTPKCFYEELPRDTLVVGTYTAEAYNPQTESFSQTHELQIKVTVEETFDNDHRVVTQTTTSSQHPTKFTFSAADSGEHRVCFTPSGPAAITVGGWFGGGAGQTIGGVRLSLDLAIGETSQIQSEDQGKIDSIVGKITELNGKLQDIRRGQVFQREREAEFRDQSEATNAKIVRWTFDSTGCSGRHMCMAIVAFTVVFH